MTGPSPAERRKAQLDAISNTAGLGYPVHTVSPENALDRLLHHLDENEPAVADAIRFGFDPNKYGPGSWKPENFIDYPEGHPNR